MALSQGHYLCDGLCVSENMGCDFAFSSENHCYIGNLKFYFNRIVRRTIINSMIVKQMKKNIWGVCTGSGTTMRQ